MSTRPLTDELGFTCDWGGCDEVAVVERHSPDHGWLPVCEHHKGPKPRGKSTKRGTCPNCAKDYALTAGDRMPLHRNGWETCPGSRKAPRSDARIRAVASEPQP